MLKTKIITITLLFFHLLSFGQKKISDISKEGYLQDFDFIVKLIKNQHPNPFRFITESDFDKKIKAIRVNLVKNPTLENFYLSNPLSLINDSHSDLIPDATLFDELTRNSTFFPLITDVYDNRVFVNQYATDIPSGAEILKVNNVKVKDILEQIPNKVDGDVQASTQKNFSQYISFIFPKSKEFTIEYTENKNQTPKTIQLKAINYNRFYYNTDKTILPFDTLSATNGISGYQLDNDTFIVSIKSFSLSEEYAYQILSNLFTLIKEKNIKNLIIDIRNNNGGSLSNIPLFYSFISNEKSFKNIYKYATKVITINVKENLVDESNRLANASDIISSDNFMNQRFDKNETDNFYYGNNRLDEYYVENYPQDKIAFTGKVALLINNNTVSAATYFAYMFQLNKRGQIIGQETRSCSNFTTAAWFLNYKLPNTESIIALPRSEVFFNTMANKDNHCRGVIPEHTITADEYQKGLQTYQDAELNLALKVIKQ